MRIAGFIKNSVVNGIGIRDVVFVQGCPHHCVGCHNPKTWSYTDGVKMEYNEIALELESSSNNVTISGGEPLLYLWEDLLLLLCELKRQGKTIWLYTGYRYEDLELIDLLYLSEFVEVLVDGRYEEGKRDLTLRFRGSSNQRLIDLPKSVKEGKVVLWEEC
jgi:anaerobic ribonucleoside-triphosphate reductase activating protein